MIIILVRLQHIIDLQQVLKSALMARTVLKSPWILGEVREKSLNSIFPWKVLKFLVAWEVFVDAFCLAKTEYKSWLTEFKGYLQKMLYVLCNN